MTIHFQKPDGRLNRSKDGLKFTRVANMTATSELDAELQLIAAGVGFGAVYRNLQGQIPDVNVKVDNIDIEPDVPATLNGVGLYVATMTYGRQTSGGADEQLLAGGPAIWEMETTQGTKDVDTSSDGDAMRNTAGTLLTGLMARTSGEILRATWLVQGDSLVTAFAFVRQFRNKLNSITFLGALPRTVMCLQMKPEIISRVDRLIKYIARFEPKDLINFSNVILPDGSVVGQFAASEWDIMRINRGLDQKNFDDNDNLLDPSTVPIMRQAQPKSTRQIPVTVPQLLDEKGVALAAGSPPFRLYFPNQDSIDFNSIIPLTQT